MELKAGEVVILQDKRGKKYPLLLKKGEVFHTHLGAISHAQIIGKREGEKIVTSSGNIFYIFRPTLMEHIMSMKRKSALIYPKDSGIIWMWADIFPGALVVEGGVGSGALLLSLIRAVGKEGKIVSYEKRQDMLDLAKENISLFYGSLPPNLILKEADIYEGIEEKDVDRIILDVPEPWRVVPHASKALKGGGIILSYVPTILQASRFYLELENSLFTQITLWEVLLRPWQVQKESVRPYQRIVGHTGFLVLGRKVLRR